MEKDLNNLTKEDLILKIKQLQQEKKLKRKYGLVWDTEKEPEQVVESCKNNIPILKNIKSKDIKTDNSQDNILIEGDNYHALQVLNYTHKNKIDVIYIDPPYNTGNKENEDFSYNDKFIDKEDGYRHSKWLNFMYKRLELAKELLTDNGIIFISIDDNEQANLKLLCDKIFGENNFITQFMWNKTATPPSLSKDIRKKYEYILCYQKSQCRNFGLVAGYNSGGDMPLLNEGNNIGILEIEKNALTFKISDGIYKAGIYDRVELLNDICVKNGIAKTNIKIKGPFKWLQETVNEEIKKGTSFVIKSEKFAIRYIKKDERIKKPSNVISKKECNVGTNEDASKELLAIFDKTVFRFPKPISLIKYLINMNSNNNISVLDFFAGSGTTGHAVLDLNRQDGGNRKFILCTNNENNICSDVCYPRIQKIIKGYKYTLSQKNLLYEEKLSFNKLKDIDCILNQIDGIMNTNKNRYESFEKKLEDNFIKIYGENNTKKIVEGLGGNLKYFKTELIPIERIDKITDSKRKELTRKAGEIIGIKEDTLQEIELNDYYQILSNNTKTKFTAIYFRESEIKLEELINKIKNKKTVLYVFSYGKVDRKMYKELSKNISIEDIPQPILDIYKELNLKFED